jgi:hypothetical protein
LRFVVVSLLSVSAAYGLLRVHTEYEAHRAISLLAEASRIHIGDNETSELSLLQRYGGYRWPSEALSPRENWIDKDEYDYQQSRLSDYKYEMAISPFGITAPQKVSRVDRAIRTVVGVIHPRLRAVLGMRDWETVVDLSIRNSRVHSVSAMTLLEGRSQWFGYKWELAEGMPHHDMGPADYSIGAANLTMGISLGVGDMIENYITPKASKVETETARQFNRACLTNLRGCDGLCDLAPLPLKYLERKPDAAWNIIPPKCH